MSTENVAPNELVSPPFGGGAPLVSPAVAMPPQGKRAACCASAVPAPAQRLETTAEMAKENEAPVSRNANQLPQISHAHLHGSMRRLPNGLDFSLPPPKFGQPARPFENLVASHPPPQPQTFHNFPNGMGRGGHGFMQGRAPIPQFNPFPGPMGPFPPVHGLNPMHGMGMPGMPGMSMTQPLPHIIPSISNMGRGSSEGKLHPEQRALHKEIQMMYSRVWRMNGVTMSRIDLPQSFLEPFSNDMSALVSSAATLQSAGDKLSSALTKTSEDLENLKLVFRAQTAEYDAYRKGMEPKLRELERGYHEEKEASHRNARTAHSLREKCNEMHATIKELRTQIIDQDQVIKVSTEKNIRRRKDADRKPQRLAEHRRNKPGHLWVEAGNGKGKEVDNSGPKSVGSSPTVCDFGANVHDGPSAPSWRSNLSTDGSVASGSQAQTDMLKPPVHLRSVSVGPSTKGASGSFTRPPPTGPSNTKQSQVPKHPVAAQSTSLNAEAKPFSSRSASLAPRPHSGPPPQINIQGPDPNDPIIAMLMGPPGGSRARSYTNLSNFGPTLKLPKSESDMAKLYMADCINPMPAPVMTSEPLNQDLNAWKKEFVSLFSAIRGFCKMYFKDTHGRDIPIHLHGNHKQLMVDMAESLQPRHVQVGYSHATHILRDNSERPLMIMRLLVQVLLEGTFGKGAWTGFDKPSDEELGRIKRDLLTTHQPDIRIALLAQRANLVSKMKSSPDRWQAFRHNVITVLSQQARQIFLPFFPSDGNAAAARDEATYDFRNCIETIVDLAFRACEAQQDFGITFAGCRTGELFFASRHKAALPDKEDVTLEAEHYRIKLAMTPVISARIFREGVLVPQTVCKANVVVLRPSFAGPNLGKPIR
ncbi:hypothetical protein OQA88_6249 [Cercophora sp. LCS_1]